MKLDELDNLVKTYKAANPKRNPEVLVVEDGEIPKLLEPTLAIDRTRPIRALVLTVQKRGRKRKT